MVEPREPPLAKRAEALIHRPPSWVERLDWTAVFAPAPGVPPPPLPRHVEVDLGAGDGGFVVERARRHPECDFLAVERLLGRVRKIARRATRAGLGNVRVLRIEASYAAEWLLPPGSVDAITVLFPDPWPKRRHHKNRLVQAEFLDACARALKPGGWLGLKTDDAPYFVHIREVAAANRLLVPWEEARAEELLPETTDFERDFLREGKPIHFLALRPRQSGASQRRPP